MWFFLTLCLNARYPYLSSFDAVMLELLDVLFLKPRNTQYLVLLLLVHAAHYLALLVDERCLPVQYATLGLVTCCLLLRV